MGTVRLAVKDLVSMGSIVTVGDPATDADGEPVRRGAAWLLIQVGAAALILGLALLVRAALGGGSGTVPLWIWVPALLLVLPFVGHVFARPVRLVAGAAKGYRLGRLGRAGRRPAGLHLEHADDLRGRCDRSPGGGCNSGESVARRSGVPALDAVATAVKAYAGSAPVTRASGRNTVIIRRQVKNNRLAAVGFVRAFATMARTSPPKDHYDQRRAHGDRHAAALRHLFNRMIGQLHHYLQTRRPYDPIKAFPERAPQPQPSMA
jgi:hypothetical protein